MGRSVSPTYSSPSFGSCSVSRASRPTILDRGSLLTSMPSMEFLGEKQRQEDRRDVNTSRGTEGSGSAGSSRRADEAKGTDIQDVTPLSHSPRPRQFDAALERRVVRKIDRHLMPLVMIL
ncbi:unnamed protein product, partial [Diplocarpon coronariae]